MLPVVFAILGVGVRRRADRRDDGRMERRTRGLRLGCRGGPGRKISFHCWEQGGRREDAYYTNELVKHDVCL